MTPSRLLHQAAGMPPYPGSVIGVCRFCGEDSTGLDFFGWVKDTFNDHDKLLPGSIICPVCQFIFDDASALLAERTGKDKLQRMRNYSHFVVGGEWLPLSKGQKSDMIQALHSNPQVAIIAEGGQKHIIFRAQRGWWQFEEKSLPPDIATLSAHLSAIQTLYDGGFSKAEIETGRYDQRRIMQFGIADFLRLRGQVDPVRDSLLFGLALFLVQKTEDADGGLSARVLPGAEIVAPPLAGPERGIQAEVRTKHLEPVRGQYSGGGIHQQGKQVRQLDLFSSRDSD